MNYKIKYLPTYAQLFLFLFSFSNWSLASFNKLPKDVKNYFEILEQGYLDSEKIFLYSKDLEDSYKKQFLPKIKGRLGFRIFYSYSGSESGVDQASGKKGSSNSQNKIKKISKIEVQGLGSGKFKDIEQKLILGSQDVINLLSGVNYRLLLKDYQFKKVNNSYEFIDASQLKPVSSYKFTLQKKNKTSILELVERGPNYLLKTKYFFSLGDKKEKNLVQVNQEFNNAFRKYVIRFNHDKKEVSVTKETYAGKDKDQNKTNSKSFTYTAHELSN